MAHAKVRPIETQEMVAYLLRGAEALQGEIIALEDMILGLADTYESGNKEALETVFKLMRDVITAQRKHRAEIDEADSI